MRLPVDAVLRLTVLGLSASLAGCGLLAGGSEVSSATDAPLTVRMAGTGPAADYPIVLGEPFTVEGELYTPADTLNYDSVGYATLDEGAGVTAAHRTLPLPSYAEITSLETGRTILVRVERRGPMTGKNLLAISQAAAAQLGASEGAPVRVRRVNPPEAERAELRAGHPAPDRIETPKSLVEVLRRKLPAIDAASLRPASPQQAVATQAEPMKPEAAEPAEPRVVTAYPLPGPSRATTVPRPVVVARAQPTARVGAPSANPAPRAAAATVKGDFVIQAGAFSSRANADRAARALGGFVSPSGKLFRVRTGPFLTRAQADAALAKVRAAGYSDARVTKPS